VKDGIINEEQARPRLTRRTARLTQGTSSCFNYHLQWPKADAALADPVSVRAPTYVFTAAERARLTVYRAAVRACFYSDLSLQNHPRRRRS